MTMAAVGMSEYGRYVNLRVVRRASQPMRQRSAKGSDMTHWRTATIENTRSTRCAAVFDIS